MTLLHRFHKLVSDSISPVPSDLPDRIAFLAVVGLVLAAVVLGPNSLSLPAAGGVYPAGEGLVFDALAFLAAAAAFLSRTSPRSLRYLTIPFSAAIGMALLGVAQLLPLPEGVLQQIASVNLQIYHETAEILSLFGRGPGPAPRISIAPRETAGAVLQLLGCIAAFLAAAAVMRTRRRRRTVFWTAALGILVPTAAAAIGLAAPAAAERPELVAEVFGLAFFAGLGIFWAEVLTNVDRGTDAVEPGDRFERRFPPLAAKLLLVALGAAGIVLARSWVTAAAAALSTVLLILMGLSRRRRERSRRLGVAAGGAAVLVALATTVLAPAAQAQSAGSPPASPDVLRAAVAAWHQFPVLGAGLGAFADAFRRVQPSQLVGYVEQARSGPFQVLVTGGAVGLFFAATLVLSLLVVLVRAWRSQKHREESALCLAGFGALVYWLLQGLADFDASSGVVPILLAALLGAAWAAGQARGSQATL